jgi:hypothetical protein
MVSENANLKFQISYHSSEEPWQTLLSIAPAISRDRVRRFAADQLRARDEMRGVEIDLKGTDDLPLLIYLRNYSADYFICGVLQQRSLI